ncbi:hypothetical protein [Pyramidobacter piscolens]|uniref:hypothetical protein n=1 Tax=Pyramidobacter piscolens TaxID=638849 RepID=UPI002491ABF4|nr:hypothetical protein [Pyramidobacter piscolens]
MTKDEYIRLQRTWAKAEGIEKGSYVRVTRAAKDRESGWSDLWENEMDATVNHVFEVADIRPDGVHLSLRGLVGETDTLYSFPFFILEPAEAPKVEKYQFTPFEQVLVRDEDSQLWYANLFGEAEGNAGSGFECVSLAWSQCIPYAGHEHLLGTTDEPEDWEKYYDKVCYDKE